MKTLFRGILSFIIGVVLCTSAFSSCTTNEVYDFEFELPGQIVTEFGQTIVIPFKARNITSVVVSSTPKGWEVKDVDLKAWTITIKAPSEYTSDSNKVVENGTLSLTGYTAASTAVHASSYLSLLNQEIDLSDVYSNSYVITQPNTRYNIDVTHKGESDERIYPDHVDILWQSETNLINFYSFDKQSNTFTFYVGNTTTTDDTNSYFLFHNLFLRTNIIIL